MRKKFFKNRSRLSIFVMYLQLYTYALIGVYLYEMVNSNKLSDLALFVIPIIFTYLFENIYEAHNLKLEESRKEIELKDIKAINVYCIAVLIILTVFAFNNINILGVFNYDNLEVSLIIIVNIFVTLLLLCIYFVSLDKIDEENNNNKDDNNIHSD